MRLQISAVGRISGTPEAQLADEYVRLVNALARQAGLKGLRVAEVEARRSEGAARLAEEGELLTRSLPPGGLVVALDRRGEPWSSEELAKRLGEARDRALPSMTFLVGGADGLAEPLLKAADRRLSFGAQTWPHRLVRAMLLEQIYRATTILVGHPYHRG
ncbi:MAG: 23S rRNA (pseudouridine(1915)-N(3))-methyltransferase RlmH [Alphaproteobacteria bacterium]|nr:23S rRNA (pseudouridine(1915)-N(3))-methyltransferase RlmH [Alphaproteobacteria bacterium]